jgi:hypothetical protein
MAEISDYGQSLTLRTRRGTDLRFELELNDGNGDPIDLTGAELVSRIFAEGRPTKEFAYSIGGVDTNVFTVVLSAAITLNMAQDWEYVIGFRLGGATQSLVFGPLHVAQEQL